MYRSIDLSIYLSILLGVPHDHGQSLAHHLLLGQRLVHNSGALMKEKKYKSPANNVRLSDSVTEEGCVRDDVS